VPVLPTFVIGLREGIEASLIVGIVAAFLRQQGRPDALRRMWVGVTAAIVLCLAVGIGLEVLNENLPQRQQEMLETVIAIVAVVMITYMIVFMRKHARHMRQELETRAGAALAAGSASALVLMAFLAVLREGFETAVFLVATLDASTSRGSAVLGALLGVLVACVIGYLIYRGGLRINLARFFTGTALVLVLVAAGLVAFAAHTAHEAGWLNVGQTRAMDLSSINKPGTVRSALITGVLGIQPRPVWAEVIGWLGFFVPVTAYVLAPRRSPSRSTSKPTVPEPVLNG
jgi:high-affinity iron transporter